MKQGGEVPADKIFSSAVEKALAERTMKHATLAVETTKNVLEAVLSKAVTEGQGTQELARQIQRYFSVHSKTRALTIARTEMTGAINNGTYATLRAEGHRGRMWSTVIDGNERADHSHADGQIVGMDEPFQVGGESCMYPGDDVLSASQICNCRCTTVAADVPIDRVQYLGEQFLRIHGRLENSCVVQLRRAFDRQRRRILSHFPS